LMKWAAGVCDLGVELNGIATLGTHDAGCPTRNDKAEANEIATPGTHGAGCSTRNDKAEANEIAAPGMHSAGRRDESAWCWMKEAATKGWRRDLHLKVSSLFLGLASRATISAHEAFSTGRVPVGCGR
jgi:hypothetical protein